MEKLYANINESSKYFYTQREIEPFPVRFDVKCTGGYIVVGAGNRYRLSDLDFFVKQPDESYKDKFRFEPVKMEMDQWLARSLEHMILWAVVVGKDTSMSNQTALFNFGQWNNIRDKLQKLLSLLPEAPSFCTHCFKNDNDCMCDYSWERMK